jgi:hypothetical protein
MPRRLKALGLTLAVVLSLTAAVAACTAQASEATFSWSAGTDKLKTEADPSAPSQLLTITPGAITASFTCDELSAEAAVTGTEGSSVTGTSIQYSDAGTTPTKEECTGKVNGIALKVPVKFNGCDYKLTAGTTEGEESGESEGTLDIQCPEGQVIEFKAAGCLVKLGSQTAGPVYFRTVKTEGGLEHLTAEARIGEGSGSAHNNALDYTTSGITCNVHNETDGTYAGKITVTGFNSSEASTNVTVK